MGRLIEQSLAVVQQNSFVSTMRSKAMYRERAFTLFPEIP